MSEQISVEYEQRIQDMLIAIRNGDRQEFDRLVETVGLELRKLSAYFLRTRPDQTLQTTALVNEIIIRLLKLIEDDPSRMPENKTHFMRLTARMMRFTLADYASAPRRRIPTVPLTGETGEGAYEIPDVTTDTSGISKEDMLAIHQALQGLEEDDRRVNKRRSEIIELHLFGGMKYTEIAESLNISPDKARRNCESGLLWLRDKLTSNYQRGA